jgi:hypothetical protein
VHGYLNTAIAQLAIEKAHIAKCENQLVLSFAYFKGCVYLCVKRNKILQMVQFELVHKTYSENIEEINERISKSKYPITFKVLQSFALKIDDILKSLESLETNQSFYSSQGLTRILYEHYLVAYYVWTKCRVDNNDECATDYNQYYAIYEMIKQENYNSKLDKSYDPTKTPLQNFLVKVPEFDDPVDPLNQENFIDINTRANKFDIRKILQYMTDDLDPNDHFKSLHVLVHDVCKKYNKISSYVHGGRMAELEAFENIPPVDKGKIMRDNVEFGRIFSHQMRDFIMMLLLAEDPSFIKTYQPIYDFVKNSTKK